MGLYPFPYEFNWNHYFSYSEVALLYLRSTSKPNFVVPGMPVQINKKLLDFSILIPLEMHSGAPNPEKNTQNQKKTPDFSSSSFIPV